MEMNDKLVTPAEIHENRPSYSPVGAQAAILLPSGSELCPVIAVTRHTRRVRSDGQNVTYLDDDIRQGKKEEAI
jgi:hypothetical protein